jgi:hypothetical protein
MKPILAVVALAGAATLVTACSGAGAGPVAVSAGSVSPVVSASPVNSDTIGVWAPVTVAEVRAAGVIGSQYLYYLPNTGNPLLSRVPIPAACRGTDQRALHDSLNPAASRAAMDGSLAAAFSASISR